MPTCPFCLLVVGVGFAIGGLLASPSLVYVSFVLAMSAVWLHWPGRVFASDEPKSVGAKVQHLHRFERPRRQRPRMLPGQSQTKEVVFYDAAVTSGFAFVPVVIVYRCLLER